MLESWHAFTHVHSIVETESVETGWNKSINDISDINLKGVAKFAKAEKSMLGISILSALLYRIREVPMQVLQSSNVYTYSWSPVDYLRCFQRLFRHFTVTTSYFFNFCATSSGAHFTQDSTPKVLMLGWALFVDLGESPARGDVNYFFARQRTLSCQCEAHKQIPKRLQQILLRLLRRVRSNRCLSN